MRIILFDEVRATADFFTYLWKEEFERRGHEVYVVHMNHFEEGKKDLIAFLSVYPDLILGYNNSPFSLEVIPGKNFWDTLGVPVVNILFDHPGAYWKILEVAPKVSIPACCDRNHLKFLDRFFPEMRKGVFIPHYGLELPGEVVPWEERKIPVLYVGSPSFPGGQQDEFATKVIEILSIDTSKTVESAMEEVVLSCTLEFLRNHFIEIWQYLESEDLYGKLPEADAISFEMEMYLEEALRKYHYLHAHITSRHRRMLVKQLVEAGIDVYAYSDWSNEKDLLANPHFHFGGMVSPMECVELMRDSKIVLNSMPWFKDGNHDRICHGMLQHAVVFSETSNYLEERFTDGEDIKLFTLQQLEQGDVVPEIVKDILNNPDLAKRIAQKGYESAKINDTVKNRVDTLLDFLGK